MGALNRHGTTPSGFVVFDECDPDPTTSHPCGAVASVRAAYSGYPLFAADHYIWYIYIFI